MNAETPAGFFTHGVSPERYHLPHPRLGLPVILLIQKVLLRAFALLREQGFDFNQATEDQVTAALRAVIENDLRQTGSVRGFDRRHYDFVMRQGQTANYDNTHISKTPDLCFRLRDDGREPLPVLSEFNALFVECKPVDQTHPAGSKYCNEGLLRFVQGHYAWAMQEGMMLAYARHGRTIEGHLLPAMKDSSRMTSLATLELPKPLTNAGAGACEHAEAVHLSRHHRDFPWPDGKGPAGAITMYHLWHRCD